MTSRHELYALVKKYYPHQRLSGKGITIKYLEELVFNYKINFITDAKIVKYLNYNDICLISAINKFTYEKMHLWHTLVCRELQYCLSSAGMVSMIDKSCAMLPPELYNYKEVYRRIHMYTNEKDNIYILLRKSIMYGYGQIAKFLLDCGVNPNMGLYKPLRYASSCGKVEMVKLLLDYGANIHYQGEEALKFAVLCQQIAVVRILLQYGANAEVSNYFLIVKACNLGNYTLVKILLDYISPDDKNKPMLGGRGGDALLGALYSGCRDICKLLLERGVDPRLVNSAEVKRLETLFK